jgi:RNA polymerase sigma-70 factor, ECF subfamily
MNWKRSKRSVWATTRLGHDGTVEGKTGYGSTGREETSDRETVSHFPVSHIENESAIVAAAQTGQVASFELLIERYEAKIFLRALRITRNWQDAEDVKLQSILKAFTQLHSFQGRSSFSTWLVRIAINEALMLLRKKRTWHEFTIENTCEPDGEIKLSQTFRSTSFADESYLAEERKSILYATLKRLTPAMRMAIQLGEIGERSTRETARIRGISLSAAKSRVFQGRRRLRELLSRDPRVHGIGRTSTRRQVKRIKYAKSLNRGNLGRRSRRQSVQHSYNSYSFPVGTS